MGLRNACEKHATSYLLPDLANIGHKSGKRKDVAPISHEFRSLEFGVIPAVERADCEATICVSFLLVDLDNSKATNNRDGTKSVKARRSPGLSAWKEFD